MSDQESRTLENFIFRGLLLHNSFDEFEALGAHMETAPTDTGRSDDDISLDDFSAAIRTQAVKMAAVYQTFFCFENAVRELVENRLSERLGARWWEEASTTTLRSKVDGRQKKEAANRWHVPRGESNVGYIDFGDLAALITNNWSHFEDLFPDQDWVRTRLSDLEMSRNVIAHNGVLNGREMTRIALYLKDWVMQVG